MLPRIQSDHVRAAFAWVIVPPLDSRCQFVAKAALIEASVDTVAMIHQGEPQGDILLFLTGQVS